MKKLLVILTVTCALVCGFSQPVMATGGGKDPLCSEITPESDGDLWNMLGCGGDTVTADTFANNLIQVVLGLVGLIAIGVMIFGGIMYVTSTGDAAKVQRAKHIVMYGIIGFVVAMLAYAIVMFIMKAISS